MKLDRRVRVIAVTLLVCAGVLVCGLVRPVEVCADPATGGDAFKKKCAACHSVEQGKNKVGPSLFAVVGRSAGKAEGFKYSDAMAKSGLTWDRRSLSEYLKDPKAKVPGNKMPFPGIKDDGEIASLIDYLGTIR